MKKYIHISFMLLTIILIFSGCSITSNNITSDNIAINNETIESNEQVTEYYKHDTRINNFFVDYNNMVSVTPITPDMILKGNTYSKVTINVNNTYITLLNNEHNRSMYFDVDSENINELKKMTFDIIKTIITDLDLNTFDTSWNNLLSNKSEKFSNNISLQYNEPSQYYNKSRIKITYVYGE